jgi:hypothetical protein
LTGCGAPGRSQVLPCLACYSTVIRQK